MGTPADSERARQQLLEAAAAAFAEHGYQATVRDICAQAGLNPGAINYHFGSKRELYAEVMRRAHPPAPLPSDLQSGELPPERRIRRFIEYFLRSTLSEESADLKTRLLANELAKPSEMLDDFVREAVRPHFLRLREAVAAVLDPDGVGDVPDRVVDDHTLSVVSQVVFYRHSRPIIERIAQRRYGLDDGERLTEHIHRAVVAALGAERRRQAARRQRRPGRKASSADSAREASA